MANTRIRSSFPEYADGDVVISLRPSDTEGGKLVLHGSDLRRVSDWFFVSLSGTWPTEQTAGLDSTAKVRYELELDENTFGGNKPDGNEGEFHLVKKSRESPLEERRAIVEQFDKGHKDELSKPKYKTGLNAGVEEVLYFSSTKPFEEIVHDHIMLFGLLYQQHLKFRDPIPTKKDIKNKFANVVVLADYYGCLSAVSIPIESYILQPDFLGLEEVASDPCFYLNLASKIRSQLIYGEVMRHIVGRWDSLPQLRAEALTRDNYQRVHLKRYELIERITDANQTLSSLTLHDWATEPDVWLAMATFKFWMTVNLFSKTITRPGAAVYYKKLVDSNNLEVRL